MKNSNLPSDSLHNEERYYYLDAVRAFALLLGIFFHGICFMVSYIAPAFWAVKESQSSIGVDVFFFVSHSFRMQAFFVIAGFFAHMLYHKRGAKGFALHRARRITLPLLIFWPVIFISINMLWIWGFKRMGYFSYNPVLAKLGYWQIVIGSIVSGKWLDGGLPLTHLWFLYVLTWFFVFILILRYLFEHVIDKNQKIRTTLDRCVSFLMTRWWGSLLLAVFTIPAMWGMKNGFGVDTPDHGFLPNIYSILIYSVYFSLGWFLHRTQQFMEGFKKYWKSNLVISLVFLSFACFLYLSGNKLSTALPDLAGINLSKMMPYLYAGVYGIASMSSVFAFIGIIMTFFTTQSRAIRYISDSSYWLYIIHLPIVVFFQILVVPMHLHWAIKLVIIFVPSFIIMLSTYQLLVRRTWIGVMLNGRKY